MYLKRVELAGFKSFADKTELEFVKGITAVVGPNGSGKSNIADAIRWVLGEQSAKSLRGGKMEDIIFAGSDHRKAVNYGEVSLTLDNLDQALQLDFSEVTVTRRLHRNGESEYFINKQGCRLKDITELFMDTGVGKEAYSIIGQGRIEEILSTRSEDRRGVFEEASGIVKYKTRKKEAQKKLDETEQNLVRIHDLLSELEDQIEPLRMQSERAQQYKRLQAQLKKDEISIYVYQIEQIHRSWTETKDSLSQLQTRQLELSAIVNAHDAELEQYHFKIRVLEQQVEQLQNTLLQLSAEFEKCEGQGEVLKERKKHLLQNEAQLELKISELEQQIANKQLEYDMYESEHAEAAEQLARLTKAVSAEEARLAMINGGLNGLDEDQLKAELLDVLNAAAQNRNELRYLEQQSQLIGRRLDKLNEEQVRWAERQKQGLERKQQSEQGLEQTATEVDRLSNVLLSTDKQLTETKRLLDETMATERKWQQKTDALRSRRDTMLEMQHDFDGFAHGVKAILKARERAAGGLWGIRGAVAELVRVPAAYELAVETALGGALQNIVVDTEAAGRKAISYLKERQLGRATFLPMDVIKGRSISESEVQAIAHLPGFRGIAVDVIEFEPQYKAIIANLLGQVIVSESIVHANQIAAKMHYRYRVVTLDGDIVHAGGSMSGGSLHKKSTSLLGRTREIDQLDQQIGEAAQQIEQLAQKTQQLGQLVNRHTVELERLRGQREQLRLQEQQLHNESAQADRELQQIAMQLEQNVRERENHSAEQAQGDIQKQLAADALKTLEEQERELGERLRLAAQQRKTDESAKEQLQQELTELKVEFSAKSQQKQSLAEQGKRMEAELNLLRQTLDADHKALLQLSSDKQLHDRDTVQQLEQLNRLKIDKRRCTEQLEFTRAERAEQSGKLELEEKQTKQQRIELKQTEDNMHQVEVRVNRLDVELDNLLAKLGQDYELSFELAKQRYPIPEDILGAQNRVRALKQQLSQLGEVNLGAVDEYVRVSERFAFLTAQQNDLIDAKTSLYQVIKEIENEMSNRFIASFEAIRAQFTVVFARLFAGGKADLILTEPENLLETGIEIIAQPPGKKLQNLQLLSGGERALTAIGLLFAILRVKPVPFCVLDEVEAALDEANVVRFAQYLREFAMNTQFIIVTHRKGTMEEADVLYGVTMEEGGVSKLVSVRLDDEQSAVSA